MIGPLINWLMFYIEMEMDYASTKEEAAKYVEMRRHLKAIRNLHYNKKYKPARMQDIRP